MKSNLIAYIGESVYTIVIAVMHQWTESRNLERGVQPPASKCTRKLLGCHAHFRSC